MNRYRITLSQVSIVDAYDKTEAIDKVLETSSIKNLEVKVKQLDDTITNKIERVLLKLMGWK
tara:strand:- start:48 stop:233 length:186 start_codon:yes stop_codon:yes gene_type:complete